MIGCVQSKGQGLGFLEEGGRKGYASPEPQVLKNYICLAYCMHDQDKPTCQQAPVPFSPYADAPSSLMVVLRTSRLYL